MFLSLVSEHRELFDKSHTNYKNQEKKKVWWQRIAEKIGIDGEFDIFISYSISFDVVQSAPPTVYASNWRFGHSFRRWREYSIRWTFVCFFRITASVESLYCVVGQINAALGRKRLLFKNNRLQTFE